MNTPHPSPPQFLRRRAMVGLENENCDNEYHYNNGYRSSSNLLSSNVSVKRTKRRPLAKPSRKNSSSYTKTKTKTSNNRTRRRPIARPSRKRGGCARGNC